MELEESGSLTSDYTTKQQSSKLYGTGTDSNTDQWNRIESPELNPRTYSQLIYNKGDKNIQWRKDSLFNKWWWENWTATWKRMKLEHSLTPYTKINSKWIKDLDIKPDTIKLLEENTGQTLSDKNDSNIFSDPPLRVLTTKTKINKWDLIKLQSFCTAKETLNNTKRQNGRKSLQVNQLTTDSSPKFMNTFCSSITKRQTTPSKNRQRI